MVAIVGQKMVSLVLFVDHLDKKGQFVKIQGSRIESECENVSIT